MTWTRRAGFALFIIGSLALGYAGYVVLDRRAYQATESRRLDDVTLASPVATVIADGSPIGEIEIPRLGLRAIVAQGESETVLDRAVGHLAETALPGETGNVVLAGHRDTFFRPLREVRPGDTITLRTPQGRFQYLVVSTAVVSPSNVQMIQPTSEPTLTLITCFPFAYIGSAPERFIVQARQLDSPRARSVAAGL